MENTMNKKSLFGIFVFCAAAMATNMTMGILASIMGAYPDVNPVTVQSVLVGPALVATIYAMFVGNLNKFLSAKKLLICAQAGLLLYGLIFWMGGGKVPIIVLICASGLAGFNQGSMNTILGLLMRDAVKDDKKRGSVLGVCTAVMSIGGVLFTTIGGILATSRWQNAYMLFFYYVIAIILELVLLPNVEPEGKNAVAAAASGKAEKGGMGKVWILSIHYFFFFLWLYCFGTNVSEYIMNTYKIGTAAQAGVAASCVTIGGIFAGLLFGFYSKILKRFTVPFLMGLSVIGLGMSVFITTSIVGIYISGILLGFAMMGANPYIMGYLAELAPGEKYGRALSIFSAFMNGGMVVAIYVIAFLTQLVCGNPADVHYKFVVAFVGDLITFAVSFLIYLPRTKQSAE